MELTTGYSIAFPLLSADRLEGNLFLLSGEVRGTCFALGGEFMITAGHVAATAPTDAAKCLVVGLHEPGAKFRCAVVMETEQLPCDLAILRVEFVVPESVSWFHRFRWSEGLLNPLDSVRSVGYAFGLHTVE